MRIKQITKPLALFSASAMLFAASGCSDTSWSYKTSQKTLSNGAWIYYTFSAMNDAASKIEEESGTAVDLAEDGLSGKKVEGKDVFEWITEEAKDKAKKYLTVEKLCHDYKLEDDGSYLKSMVSMYTQYFDAGYMDLYKEMGVSVQTFSDIYGVYPYRYEQLFDYVYGKDGPKAVSDDELKKYFKEKYTSYYYLSYSFKTEDEEGNETDIDSETKDKVKDEFAKYANELNSGKKTSAIDAEYKTDFETETVPSVRATAVIEDKNLPEEVEKTIKELKDKTATVKTIDDVHYMIYKGSIDEEAELLVKEETETSETTETTSSEASETSEESKTDESSAETSETSKESKTDESSAETSETSEESKTDESSAETSETSEESKTDESSAETSESSEEVAAENEEETLTITKDTVLHSMKDDDFKTFIESEQKKIKPEVNDSCLSKYTIQRTYGIVKDYYKKQAEKQQ